MSVASALNDGLGEAAAALWRMDLFRDLSETERAQILAVAEIEKVPQDRVLVRGGTEEQPEHFCFVLEGQVAFGEFTPGTVPREIKKKKRVAPTMQVTRRIVALFEVGDFFSDAHVEFARNDEGEKQEMGLFTCLHVRLLKIPKRALNSILEAVPALKERIEIRAEESYYRQTFLKIDDRARIFDFYVREGFEYADAIKIIQTDKCIDCDECIKACEDRHGIARIERFGPKLGLVQFTLNCRSCADARCIDVCNFDAIGYDGGREVIVYDNCVGCTLCAKACPHEAIRMVDIVEMAAQEARPDTERPATVIAAGEEARPKKKKKPKRIANKCDHCFGFDDMACISACPTGAIIQIDPRSLFRRDGGLIERAEHYFDPAPFEKGFAEVDRSQGVLAMWALFALSTLGVLAAAFEYWARNYHTEFSLYRLGVRLLKGPAAADELVFTAFTATYGLGRWYGYIGSAMMIASALYTLRLHLPVLRRIGSGKTWFDFHVVFGLVGPALVMLHTDFAVLQPVARPLVTTLFWGVVWVVLFGAVGRWLYTAIPKLEHAVVRERKRLDEGIQNVADQWASMTMSANVLAQFMKAQEKVATPATDSGRGIGAFIWAMLSSEWTRIRGEWGLRFRTLGDMRNARLRRATIRLMGRRAAIERRAQFYGVARRLLTWWRAIHVGVSILVFVLLVAHVALSVYAVGW